MKIQLKEHKVICENKNSMYRYFAWPTVGKLQDGRLAMVASGLRMSHLCPFGKVIICYSEDEGKTWTLPAVLIDTPLDDRDGGICTFGENGVLVTSFSHHMAFMREFAKAHGSPREELINAHYDWLETNPDAEKIVGPMCVISNDQGKSFGEIQPLPVTNPHGPCCLKDGSMLLVGNEMFVTDGEKFLKCYRIQPDGSYEYLGSIENDTGMAFEEPHAIQLESGKIIVHIRVQDDKGLFTTFQSNASLSDLKFSKPRQILSDRGGAPAHLLKHSSGALISTYGYRAEPFGVRAMISYDDGKTWSKDHVIYDNKGITADLGYPSSVELSDGRILTIYYAHPESARKPAVIMQTIWSIEE